MCQVWLKIDLVVIEKNLKMLNVNDNEENNSQRENIDQNSFLSFWLK